MNKQLRENTIKRIEQHGFEVKDNGGKRAPHSVVFTGPNTPTYTVQRALTDNDLYAFADILDGLAHVGRLSLPNQVVTRYRQGIVSR